VSRAVKRPRPPLPPHALAAQGAILTTGDVAQLLRVHPKHVYRLLRQGLPGHRMGGEWRFFSEEVLRWSGRRESSEAAESESPSGAPPLVAANGDLAVERLLARAQEPTPDHAPDLSRPGDGASESTLGLVQGDRSAALALLERGAVLAAGYHGEGTPQILGGSRLAFIHLVHRPIGLAVRSGIQVPPLRQLHRRRFASRPSTAGVRATFDGALRHQGIDPHAAHAQASLLASHGDVACAVARGDADVGLVSAGWARRVGLDFLSLYREAYGFLVRVSSLPDPRIIRLREVAQSAAFRRDVSELDGYDASGSGSVQLSSQSELSL
jgi:putative molybdopterin biosynthesis protein